MTILDYMVVEEPESVRVELRCPAHVHTATGCHPGKLFATLQLTGEEPSYIQPDNLIVLACLDCKQRLRRKGEQVFRVLHCYDFAGTLVKTLREDFPDD